ncbi:hypothetical protein DL95DRAFT_509805 [Leptodontidium sp. 2 PMI_412]|nr:hypothetical protein DL95DRAFT_509805 [Leptodontidium sp. 2 PMI_412]
MTQMYPARPFPLFTHMGRRPRSRQNQERDNSFICAPITEMSPTSPSPNSPPSSPGLQPKTFILFPLLPTELQLYIWELVFNERRVIPIYVAPFIHTSLGGLPAYIIPSSYSSTHGVPVQIAPRTQMNACALVRFLRSSGAPPGREVHTRPLTLLKAAPYVCKFTFEIYNRMYKRMLVMRGDRKLVEVRFNPRRDVVFFKMGLSSKMHTFLSLEAFVNFQPDAAKCLRRIAVETVGAVESFVPVLRGFGSLEEVAIVLPIAKDYSGSEFRFTDAVDNVDGYNQRAWELGLSIQRAEDVEDLKWRVKEVVRRELERVKAERWIDWEIPSVRVVEQWEDVSEI